MWRACSKRQGYFGRLANDDESLRPLLSTCARRCVVVLLIWWHAFMYNLPLLHAQLTVDTSLYPCYAQGARTVCRG